MSSGSAHPSSKRVGAKLAGFAQRRERSGSVTGNLRRRKGSSGYFPMLILGRKRPPSEVLTRVPGSVVVEILMIGGTLVTVYI